MKIRADLHSHTVGSGHAYSTLDEMAYAAKRKGLKLLAVTDHGPGMPDGPHEYYFYNLRILPTYLHGVRILKGIEANIIKQNGQLDLDNESLAELDLVIASAHIKVSPEKLSVKQNTKMYINAMQNPNVDILGHIENPQFPINYKEVVGAAKELGKLIEINNASFTVARAGSYNNCVEIMKLIKTNGMYTVVNSDSHIANKVGEVSTALKLALEIGIKKEQILNLDHKKTAAYFKIKL